MCSATARRGIDNAPTVTWMMPAAHSFFSFENNSWHNTRRSSAHAIMSSSEAESNRNDESSSLIAAVEWAQQCRRDAQRFSDHLLVLEDIFFFEDRRHEDLFLLSCRLLAPVVPFSELEQEAAQNRFVRLVKNFEQTCQDELRRFDEETEEVRKLYRALISAEERRWSEKESQRQDEFAALCQICRREVNAVVARVRADTAQSTTEIDAMETLKVSLAAKCAEVETLRLHIQQLVQSHELERKKWLEDISRERHSARELVQADREAFTEQLHAQIKQAEEGRAAHHEELLRQHKKYTEQMDIIRSRLVEQQDESDKLRRRMDEVSVEHSRELRFHAEEKNRLNRMITDLEISYETLKRNLQEVDTNAQLNQMNLEHMSETKKLLEIQSFKRRLADTTKLLAANSRVSTSEFSSPRTATPRSYYGGDAAAASPGGVASYRAMSIASTETAGSVPPPYRESSTSVLKSISSPSSYRDRSKSPGGSSAAQLQRPSDTFVRLSNLSRQISSSAGARMSSPYPAAA